MRMRIISSAVVLGLGIVGITLAQQSGQQSNTKATWRAQAAKLRAEVELLQLEQEVDEEYLKTAMGQMRVQEGSDAGVLRMEFEKKVSDSGMSFGALIELKESVRTYIEGKKKEYAKQAEKLAEKRLELAEAEKRYNDAR
jgi:hypothetical protein